MIEPQNRKLSDQSARDLSADIDAVCSLFNGGVISKQAWIYQGYKQYQKANRLFYKIIKQPLHENRAEYDGAFVTFCDNLFRDCDRFKTANVVKKLCFEDVKKNGETPWSMIFLAVISEVFGDTDSAIEYYKKVHLLGDTVIGNLHGSYTVATPNSMIDLAEYKPICSKVSNKVRDFISCIPREQDNFVLVLSCDGEYLNKFGKGLAESLVEIHFDSVLHLHLINVTHDQLVEASNLLNKKSIRFNLSFESFDVKQFGHPLNVKSVYTCGRFIHLPELLEAYNRPILITEFDAKFCSDLTKYVQQIESSDIALSLYNNYNHLPWNRVWAGSVFVKNNSIGMDFAKRLSSFCHKHIDEFNGDGKLWHLDQNALYGAYEYVNNNYSTLKFIDLNMRPAIIKHIGGVY